MSRRKREPLENRSRRPPATTPEDRESQISSLAFDLVEQRLRDGTASSQETVWALKMGSIRERAELAKLKAEGELIETKRALMDAQKANEGLYAEAISAFRTYSGETPPMEVDEYDEYEH